MTSFETDRSIRTRLPSTVYVVAVIVFVLGTSEFGIAGLLPEIAADLDVSVPHAGLLISAYAIAMVVGAPTLTILGIRLGARTMLLLALAVFVAGQVAGALATNYDVLLAARIIAAGATGAFWAAAAAVVVGAVGPRSRARALAAQMGGLTLANVIGVPLGTLIGQHVGWRAPFWILAGGAVIAALVVTRTIEDPARSADTEGIRSELATFRDKRVWITLGIIAAFQTAVMSCFSYLAPLVTEVAEMSDDMVPVVLASFGLGSLVGVQVGGRLAVAHPNRAAHLGLGGILGALLLLVIGAQFGPLTLTAALALGAATFIGSAALQGRLFAHAGGAPRLAGAISASAFNVGAALGPWLGGQSIGLAWHYRGPTAVGTIVAGAALLGYIAATRTRPDREL